MSNVAEEPKAKNASGGMVIALAVLFVLFPLFYVLSIGPANWMLTNGVIDGKYIDTVRTLYMPVLVVHANIPATRPVIDGYLGLFE